MDFSTPLTDEEINFIEQTLEKYGSEFSIIGISELDGFLTGIVSGPEAILPSEWLPAIWGDDEDQPDWQSEEEFGKFMELVVQNMNYNAFMLLNFPEEFEPLYYEIELDGKEFPSVDEWCTGFLRAIALRDEAWGELPDDVFEFMNVFYLFGTEEGRTFLQSNDQIPMEDAIKMVKPAIVQIHSYWMSLRAEEDLDDYEGFDDFEGTPVIMDHPGTIVYDTPKVGRNDPCPCGSGKKFKQCCGAH